MHTTAIIPARYASMRYPGKPLALLAGKPVIQHTYESVSRAGCISHTIVATDDERIADAVRSFGGAVGMTSPNHMSGTDRCAEVATDLESDLIINVQGDEPFVSEAQLQQLIGLLDRYPIATLAHPITDPHLLDDTNVVKVVFSDAGRAVYFSRLAVPYQRDVLLSERMAHHTYYQHVGVYGFRMNALREVTRLAASPIEQAERLEQLRWLAAGYSIGVGITDEMSIGIDTPEDLVKAEELLEG